MKKRRLLALTAAFLLAGAGISPAFAAPDVHHEQSSKSTISAESIAPLIKETAVKNGFAQRLVLWGIADGTIHIGLSSVTGQERSLLQKALPLPVRVSIEEPVDNMVKTTKANGPVSLNPVTPRPKPGSAETTPSLMAAVTSPPLIDSTPYYGGDRLVRTYSSGGQTYVSQCTAGGVYTSGGTLKMATAGHCGPTGTLWYQGYYDTVDQQIYISGTMGNTISSQYGGGAIDAAMLSGNSYAPSIWTSSTSSLPIAGQAAVGNGTSICTAGSFTGFSCGGKVDLVDICTNYTDGNMVCGLDRATAPYRLVQSGDSGGPVVVNNGGSSASLAGIISGGTSTGTTVYFTHINRVVNTMGVSVAHY